MRHLQEELDVVNQQMEEMTNLKKIAEKQLEEALESLQVPGQWQHEGAECVPIFNEVV